jgi:hypothetical protein
MDSHAKQRLGGTSGTALAEFGSSMLKQINDY